MDIRPCPLVVLDLLANQSAELRDVFASVSGLEKAARLVVNHSRFGELTAGHVAGLESALSVFCVAPSAPARAGVTGGAAERVSVRQNAEGAIATPEGSQAPLSERLWVLLNDVCARQALNSTQLCTIDEARVLAGKFEKAQVWRPTRPGFGLALVEVPNV